MYCVLKCRGEVYAPFLVLLIMTSRTKHCRPRILVAEDDDVMRYTVKRIIEQHYDVIGEAADGQAVLELAEELRPDVIVLDISMPVLNGFEAARRIRERMPDARIVMVSSHSTPYDVEQAFHIGVQGYVFKASAISHLPQAIDDALNGRVFRPPLNH